MALQPMDRSTLEVAMKRRLKVCIGDGCIDPEHKEIEGLFNIICKKAETTDFNNLSQIVNTSTDSNHLLTQLKKLSN